LAWTATHLQSAFQANGAGALHHIQALAVIDEFHALVGGEAAGGLLGDVNVDADLMQGGAKSADHRPLDRIIHGRQEYMRCHIQHPRAIGHTLTVIAGRRGDRAAQILGAQQMGQRAAQLEAGDWGGGFVLDPDIGLQRSGQQLAAH
jgi:hypothetical protein